MSESVRRGSWELENSVDVPDTEEFEELQDRVASLEKQNKTLAATVINLWLAVTELKGRT